MLNESIEARGYLFDPAGGSCDYQSLNAKLFCGKKGDLNGLDRAMTMVARYFLFEDGVEGEQAIARAGAALRMWCGLTPEKLEDALMEERLYLLAAYPWLEQWLPDLLKREGASEDGPNSDIVQKTLAKLEKRRGPFAFSAFTQANENNNFKLLNYEKVIANALIAGGPLKRYYLVCDDPGWFLKIRKQRGTNRYAKPMSKDEDKVLKLLSAYLLETNRKKKRTASFGFEPINLNAVAAWLGASTKYTNAKYTVFTYAEQNLFEFELGISGNTIKVRPDADWMNSCNWQLIDGTDGDDALDDYLAAHPGAIFYSDSGTTAPLEKNVRYGEYGI